MLLKLLNSLISKCLLFMFHRENTSVSVEPMDDDFYNNNVTNSKPGVKRRAAEELQSGISQVKFKNLWCVCFFFFYIPGRGTPI